MEPAAVIFDLDGTLVDSNDAHVRAWCTALEAGGFSLPLPRIAAEIGKGGDQLVPALLGPAVDPAVAKRLREGSGRAFAKIAQTSHLAIMPRAVELLSRLRHKGLKIAVATSAAPPNQKLVASRAGLALQELADVVVNGGDADHSKPEPDLLAVAMQRLAVHPARCVMVGDTPHDGEAALRAGVAFVGVASGFHDAAALRAAGARIVYPGVGELLDDVDAFLRICFPLPIEYVEETLNSLMHAAVEVARRALDHGEVPIATLVADRNGTVFARAHERIRRTRNMTAHSTVIALQEAAGRRIGFEGQEVLILSTVEPCAMCTAACIEARADTVVFGVSSGARAGRVMVRPPLHRGAFMPRIIGGVAESACRELLHEWMRRNASDTSDHHAFVRELLGE